MQHNEIETDIDEGCDCVDIKEGTCTCTCTNATQLGSSVMQGSPKGEPLHKRPRRYSLEVREYRGRSRWATNEARNTQ
jgi:hypothetical protein